jgi:putative spermidine/putrescine transport system substrate-binding protein/spermidine/putrescine transport system substrate-binding protein
MLLGSAAVMALLPLGVAAGAAELRMLIWEGYADEQWVSEFEQTTGADVNVAYTGSVDEMFAKMKGSDGADYDLIALDTSGLERYFENGLILPIDLAKVPNAANLLPAFANNAATQFDGATYGLPFAWGSLPMIVDADAFGGTLPDSWSVMWDPAYAQQMIVLDDANNNIVNTAIMLGIADPFNLSDAEFDQVKAKLIEQKPLVLTYYAGFEDGVNIFSQGGVSLMFSMGEPQKGMLQEHGINAEIVIPREGAVGWLDCWVLSKGVQDADLAHQWINLMLDRRVGAYISQTHGYGNTTDGTTNDAAGLDYSDRLVWLQAPEDFERRTNLWNEVKAAPVP